MCGIFGLYLPNISLEEKREIVKSLLLASQIRGKHATGIATIKENKIIELKENVPAEVFVETKEFKSFQFEKEIIGHVRYSTSGNGYPMPLTNKFSLVHNGVITQADKKYWPKEFQYKTENDSEILLRFLEESTLEKLKEYYPKLSYAYIYLTLNQYNQYGNRLFWKRNGQRPLYQVISKNAIVIASTLDVFYRSTVLQKLNISHFPNSVYCDDAIDLQNRAIKQYMPIQDMNLFYDQLPGKISI